MVEMKDVSSYQVANGAARQHIHARARLRARTLLAAATIHGQFDLPGRVFIGNYVRERECCRGVSGPEGIPAGIVSSVRPEHARERR